jgi:hypothetical protein
MISTRCHIRPETTLAWLIGGSISLSLGMNFSDHCIAVREPFVDLSTSGRLFADIIHLAYEVIICPFFYSMHLFLPC